MAARLGCEQGSARASSRAQRPREWIYPEHEQEHDARQQAQQAELLERGRVGEVVRAVAKRVLGGQRRLALEHLPRKAPPAHVG